MLVSVFHFKEFYIHLGTLPSDLALCNYFQRCLIHLSWALIDLSSYIWPTICNKHVDPSKHTNYHCPARCL